MPFHKWNYWILFSCCSDSKFESVSPIIVMMFLEAKSWHCLWMLRSPKASSACSTSRFTVRRVTWYIFDEPHHNWSCLNWPGQKFFSSASTRSKMLTREHKEESLWAWTCHNCEHAGMTRFIPQCPECQHPRCQHCLSKCIKIGKPYSIPTIFYNEENNITLSSRGIAINFGAHNNASPSTWTRNPNNGIETESSAKVLEWVQVWRLEYFCAH